MGFCVGCGCEVWRELDFGFHRHGALIGMLCRRVFDYVVRTFCEKFCLMLLPLAVALGLDEGWGLAFVR